MGFGQIGRWKYFLWYKLENSIRTAKIFFLKGALICFFNTKWYLADIRPEKINSANFVDAWSKFFSSKIDFFRFFQKWYRMDVNIEYWLETCFEHFGGLFGTISDRLWCSDGRLKKIDFLKKMQFLRFFGISEFVVLDTKRHPKNQIF